MLVQRAFTTLELMARNVEAWAALPAPYREDSCLEFIELWGLLFCRPTEEERPILGDWECVYSPKERVWKDTKTGRPIND